MRTVIGALVVAGLLQLCVADAAMAQQRTIAVFTKNATNPAYEAFRLAADQVAREAGDRTVHYVPVHPDNVEEQKALVDKALADHPDIILFAPVDDKAMIDSVKKINDAKIPAILFINQIPGKFVTYVGYDDVAVGETETKALAKALNGQGNVVIIEGVPAAPTSRERVEGMHRALAPYPGIKVVDSGIGNYQRPDAKKVMAEMLRKHDRIDGVLAANDVMALGALEALHEAGRRSTVVGVNGIPEASKAIGDGKLLASVDFSAFKVGCIATQAALRYLKGETLPERTILSADLIDRSNYQEFTLPLAQRRCPAPAGNIQ